MSSWPCLAVPQMATAWSCMMAGVVYRTTQGRLANAMLSHPARAHTHTHTHTRTRPERGILTRLTVASCEPVLKWADGIFGITMQRRSGFKNAEAHISEAAGKHPSCCSLQDKSGPVVQLVVCSSCLSGGPGRERCVRHRFLPVKTKQR